MLPEYQLIHGVRTGCLFHFNEAVQRGAGVDATDFHGRSALEVAIRGDRPEVARRLMQMGADPNGAIGKRGDKLIHLAARLGSIGMLSVLLEEGADPNARGHLDRTALHYAARSGFEFMARMLVKCGAINNLTDANAETPAMLAIRENQDGCIRLLRSGKLGVPLRSEHLTVHTAAETLRAPFHVLQHS